MFHKAFDTVILTPRLQSQADGTVGCITIDGDDIRVSGRSSDVTTQALFADLNAIVDYLSTRLPFSIAMPLSAVLLSSLISRLISGWLSNSVPTDLEGIPDFQAILGLTLAFCDSLDSHGWHGKNDLVEWTDRAPKVWLARRRETSLDKVRRLLMKGLGDPKMAERVETQLVTREDNMFAGDDGDDDWDAGWSDNEDKESPRPRQQHDSATKDHGEEEDVSAWGLDENNIEDNPRSSSDDFGDDKDGTDAWGWGDEDEKESAEAKTTRNPAQNVIAQPRSNGRSAKKPRTEREMTLRETYTVTALPDPIFEIILQVISDAKTLAQPRLVMSIIIRC